MIKEINLMRIFHYVCRAMADVINALWDFGACYSIIMMLPVFFISAIKASTIKLT